MKFNNLHELSVLKLQVYFVYVSLSSSFPRHRVWPNQTARTCMKVIKTNMVAKQAVLAEPTQFIAGLCKPYPFLLVAITKLIFGKMAAYKEKWKDIFLIPNKFQKMLSQKAKTRKPMKELRVLNQFDWGGLLQMNWFENKDYFLELKQTT